MCIRDSHYIVSDEDGVREMADSQVLLTENGKDNLPGSMDDSRDVYKRQGVAGR